MQEGTLYHQLTSYTTSSLFIYSDVSNQLYYNINYVYTYQLYLKHHNKERNRE
jgi:hypothetical protein